MKKLLIILCFSPFYLFSQEFPASIYEMEGTTWDCYSYEPLPSSSWLEGNYRFLSEKHPSGLGRKVLEYNGNIYWWIISEKKLILNLYSVQEKYDNSGFDYNFLTGTYDSGSVYLAGTVILKYVSGLRFINKSIYERIQESAAAFLSKWELQGEFEKTISYQNRIKDSKSIMIEKYKKKVLDDFKTRFSSSIDYSTFFLSKYNPDKEIFVINTAGSTTNLTIKIPIDEAKNFKLNFSSAKFKNQSFKLYYNKLVFSSLDIEIGNKTFKYINPIFEDTINNNSTIKKKRIPKSNF